MARFEAQGMLEHIDQAVVARYCELWARSVELDQTLAREPLTFVKVTVDGAGQEHREVKKHPLLIEARGASLAVLKYLVEFGWTPASRGRVKIPKTAETKAKGDTGPSQYLKALAGGKG